MSNRAPLPPAELYAILLKEFGDLGWWPASDAVEMMTGAILTQNTAWSNVERAIAAFDGRLNARFILDCAPDTLADIIRPAGYYNIKARRLQALMRWFAQYDFDCANADSIDDNTLRASLLAVSGVGGETADSIMVYAFGRTSFVIDAYTRRLLSRLGHDIPDGYEPLRLWMEQRIPCDITVYNRLHAHIVELCKRFCTKRSPLCERCPLTALCLRRGL